jgi:hypothetical protein
MVVRASLALFLFACVLFLSFVCLCVCGGLSCRVLLLQISALLLASSAAFPSSRNCCAYVAERKKKVDNIQTTVMQWARCHGSHKQSRVFPALLPPPPPFSLFVDTRREVKTHC